MTSTNNNHPRILAHVNMKCPDDKYPKLDIYISGPILVSYEHITVRTYMLVINSFIICCYVELLWIMFV